MEFGRGSIHSIGIEKQNRHFKHPSTENLLNLPKRSEVEDVDTSTLQMLEEMVQSCENCKTFSRPSQCFRLAALPDKIIFNEKSLLISCGLKFDNCTRRWLSHSIQQFLPTQRSHPRRCLGSFHSLLVQPLHWLSPKASCGSRQCLHFNSMAKSLWYGWGRVAIVGSWISPFTWSWRKIARLITPSVSEDSTWASFCGQRNLVKFIYQGPKRQYGSRRSCSLIYRNWCISKISNCRHSPIWPNRTHLSPEIYSNRSTNNHLTTSNQKSHDS